MTEKKSKKGLLLLIGIIICLCVMVYAGMQIFLQTQEDRQGEDTYSSLKQAVVSDDSTGDRKIISKDDTDLIDPTVAGTSDASSSSGVDSDGVGSSERANIGALKKLAKNAVGWIYSPGTVVDYPVMHGTDNSFYLTHMYNGVRDHVGSIFLDYRNSPDFSDRNSVIYGHHMRSGKMFGSFEGYKKQSYYDEHPVLELDTAEGKYDIELAAGYVISGEVNNLLDVNDKDDDAFLAYVKNAKRKSTFRSDVDITANDRAVTLVTCTYNFTNARFVLVGKLVKK